MKDNFFSLDNTLRYIVAYRQVRGGKLMAIKFNYRGQTYIADTPEEAARLRILLEDSYHKRSKADIDFWQRMVVRDAGWTEKKFWSVLDTIGKLQAELLEIIMWSEVPADILAKELKLPSQEALAGVLSGLSKQLKPLNIRTSDVVKIETLWIGKKRQRWFMATDAFSAAASEYRLGHKMNERDPKIRAIMERELAKEERAAKKTDKGKT